MRSEHEGGSPQFALRPLTPVVKRLLITYLALYLALLIVYLAGGNDSLYRSAIEWLGFNGGAWIAHFPVVPAWQLFSYGFLHSLLPQHLLFNGLMLYFFGTMLESELGGRRFFLTFIGAQIAGALVLLVACAFGFASAPVVGASGAILGVLTACATLHPDRLVYVLLFPVRLKWLVVVIVSIDIVMSLLQLKDGGGGVAYLVHVGGALYGFVAVKTGLVRIDPIRTFERKREVSRAVQAQADEARMDLLLQKIHREGMNSLTGSEREFLKRASRR